MTDYLTQVDGTLIELHFARETIVTERFSVTTSGWHRVWLMTQFDGAYAKTDEVMVRSEAIVWSRYKDVRTWVEVDNENLIPIKVADKRLARLVTNHLNHGSEGNDEGCLVSARKINGYGWVYRINNEEELDDGPVLPEVR